MAEFKIECLQTKTERNKSQYSKFVLEPLERGQGTTLGNALRRVLLSNLKGTAITAIRISGVNHEFATIEGVREDVLEIMLNMKEVVLKSYTNARQIGRLIKNGPANVTAKDFALPSEVEIVDPSQYIATLAEGAKLEMEFQIEKGTSYQPVEKRKEDTGSLDYLGIDAAFMPVTKVNYSVEDVQTDGTVAKERLILEIWTNGSLKPEEALSQAAAIVVDLFNPLKDLNIIDRPEEFKTDLNPENQILIEELQLSVRAYNCLKRAQINSVADLLSYSQEELLEIKNFGQKSAVEVMEALKKRLGITLPLEKAEK